MPEKDAAQNDFLSRLNAESEGKLDTDLGGMDKETATQYVLAFATTLKETQKAREEAEREKALWEGRVQLAQSKNEELLAAQAEKKAGEIEGKLSGLRGEEAELRRKVSFMKDELKRLSAKPELSLDPEALLAQFEQVLGQPDTTAKKIKETEASLELEKLKKKLEEEGK